MTRRAWFWVIAAILAPKPSLVLLPPWKPTFSYWHHPPMHRIMRDPEGLGRYRRQMRGAYERCQL